MRSWFGYPTPLADGHDQVGKKDQPVRLPSWADRLASPELRRRREIGRYIKRFWDLTPRLFSGVCVSSSLRSIHLGSE